MGDNHRPGIVAVLSIIIPGLGQFYNGTFWRGIFWLIVTPGIWVGSGGFLGWICHVISAITAYNYAQRSYERNKKPAFAELMKKEENFDILKSDKD